jgi:ATP synthase protein I
VVLAQAVAVVIVGSLFLLRDVEWSLGVCGGGAIVVIGTALLAIRVFRPPPARAAVTMRRFALGILLKWLVMIGGFFLILVRLRMPLVPVLIGAGAAMMANWLVLRFDV